MIRNIDRIISEYSNRVITVNIKKVIIKHIDMIFT
jgi:hypothetical protein